MDRRHPLTAPIIPLACVALLASAGPARAQADPADDQTEKTGQTAGTDPEAGKTTPAVAKCECPPPKPCPTTTPPPPPPAPPAPSAPAVEWKAQSKGGMLLTTGNAESKNFNFGLIASRKEGNNKLALEGGAAYGTSNVLVAHTDDAGNTAVEREQITSTNNWAAKGRYDRFITENNTAFADAQGAGDKIAGKTFFGGGQAGYSRQLRKDAWNIVVAELGYDFSYERYVQSGLDPVSIHSARVFVGETLSLSKETGVTASIEGLFNLNKESKAVYVKDNSMGVPAFKDIRINAKVGLTTNLWRSLSFGFGFSFKYDQNPAPRPAPKDANGFTYPVGGSYYYADKLDTFTEASLIYTFF